MAAIMKRKATDVDHNGLHSDDRPTLKRRGTSASQVRSQDHNFDQTTTTTSAQNQCDSRNDSAMSSYNDNYLPPKEEQQFPPTPPNSLPLIQAEFPPPESTHRQPQPSPQPFQSLLTTFCHEHGHTFGPRYLPDLQTSHSQATSTSLPGVVLAAGQAFTRTIRSYIEDLQAAALAQVQLRAKVSSICVDRAVLDAVDAVLAKLDKQMISIMAQTQGLELELAALEEQMREARDREPEMAML